MAYDTLLSAWRAFGMAGFRHGGLSAWRTYLAHDNHGRPVVFSSHSQGAAMLIRLIAAQIDPDRARRARTALAVLVPAAGCTVVA